MSDLAAFVGGWTDRPLLDKTGIKGLYRFDQAKGFQPMNLAPDPAGPLADELTVFQMFETLGLKMEAQKGVVDLDHSVSHRLNSTIVPSGIDNLGRDYWQYRINMHFPPEPPFLPHLNPNSRYHFCF